MSTPAPSKLDFNQVLPAAFDDESASLRVNAEITANFSGAQEVIISQTDDSIRIGDGTTLITSTPGPSGHQGLDVNITGGSITTKESGLSNFQTSQYSINTSLVQIAPTPLNNRTSLSIRVSATGGAAVFIGNSNSLTISNGYPLYDGDTLQMDLTTANSLYAVSDAAGQTLYLLEIA